MVNTVERKDQQFKILPGSPVGCSVHEFITIHSAERPCQRGFLEAGADNRLLTGLLSFQQKTANVSVRMHESGEREHTALVTLV